MNNELVTAEDMAIMAQHDYATLAQWWCKLNSWEWPSELPNEESRSEPGGKRSWALMCYIEKQVGHRECSWQWNRERMTPDEFSDFYRGTFEGDVEASRRDRERVFRKLGIPLKEPA